MSDTSRYAQRGVSASKHEVHEAIQGLDKGIFPNAFCKVLPDIVGSDKSYCNIMHADTAGTKTSLAYIYWRETGDLSIWKGIVQDAIVMNIDDMACIGCIDNVIISSTIGRNKSLIPGEVIREVIQGNNDFLQRLNSFGLNYQLAGGETADVGDIVRTIDVGITAFGRMKREDVIVTNVQPGQVIVGFSSYGQSSYEENYNGGMGSNGLTSARHDVLQKDYLTKYPESFDPSISEELIYSGAKSLTEKIDIPGVGQTQVGKLILSPTRTYVPLIQAILREHKDAIGSIIHCTGGAQTKVMKFVQGRKIVKDSLLPRPPLFELIQEQSGTSRKEMYEVFNMGHRLEIYTDESTAAELIDIARSFSIDAKIIGHVQDSESNVLVIKDESGTYTYE